MGDVAGRSSNPLTASALEERGYDLQLVVDDRAPGTAGATPPEALRWLWRPASR